MRMVSLVMLLAVAACELVNRKEPVRTTEVWEINFDTWFRPNPSEQSDLEHHLWGLGFSDEEIEEIKANVIEFLYEIYEPWNIKFVVGEEAPNYICVRWGSKKDLGGAAWSDPGNNFLNHNCGNQGLIELGVFANQISYTDRDGFTLKLAITLSHEIGHSVGLIHQEEGIMTKFLLLKPYWDSESVSILNTTLGARK